MNRWLAVLILGAAATLAPVTDGWAQEPAAPAVLRARYDEDFFRPAAHYELARHHLDGGRAALAYALCDATRAMFGYEVVRGRARKSPLGLETATEATDPDHLSVVTEAMKD